MRGVKDILIFSTADWDNPFWTNKQHMAVRFSTQGYRVLYVESLGLRQPTFEGRDLQRIFRRLRRFFAGARPVQQNIWVFSPLVLPFHRWAWVRRLNHWLLVGSLSWLRLRLGFQRMVVWSYNPMIAPLARSLRPELLVFHSVDDLTAAPRLPKAEIEAAEADLLRDADFVFVTSPELAARYETMGRADSVFLPNVVDYDHFHRAVEIAEAADLASIPRPRAGFIGAISGYKLDFDLLRELALRHPEFQFVLIGQVGEGDPGTDISRLKAPNLHLLGPRSYERLPEYLAGFDVALLPCARNDYTRSMFPMKFFEYLAAGKTVIGTPLPSLKPFERLYWGSEGIDGFSASLERFKAGERIPAELADEFARKNTWETRLRTMLEMIEGEGS